MDKNCVCDNEAKVLYDMWKLMGSLRDGTFETGACCEEGTATVTVDGKTITLTYASGRVASYTENGQ